MQEKQLNIQIPIDLHNDFERVLRERGRKKGDQVRRLIETWVSMPQRESSQEHLADTLIRTVVNHLLLDKKWAIKTLEETNLVNPAEIIFYGRVGHFRLEKACLARNFVPWLLERVASFAARGEKTYLVIDSGTTLKILFDELGPALLSRRTSLPVGQLEILTNNFHGAEAYESFCANEEIRQLQLSRLFPCRLLPGSILPEYGAIAGAEAEAYLEKIRASADGKSRFIGLTVGNWVNVRGLCPIPLVRGKSHSSFKQTVLATSDEVFVISPLCKIIWDVDAFNRDLGATDRGLNIDDNRYKALNVSGVTPEKLRLVSTFRHDKKSVVILHSDHLLRQLKHGERQVEYDSCASSDLKDLPHFFYPFDEYSRFDRKQQIESEFPHERTRADSFLSRHFQVKPE